VNLWQLPEVLVLGLKRYKQQPNGSWFGLNQHRRKIDNFVEFPLENLNLKSYTDAESPEMNCVYDLFAVCNHYGRMGFGHYTAATRSWEENSLSPVWYSYDDDVVGKCSLSEVKTSAAYVLFYRKRPATTS
jgi:ubiquitin carboxyl-terminal hydrolase 4/11/15